jgi:hypothetical protein
VILKSELDSLIKLYNNNLPKTRRRSRFRKQKAVCPNTALIAIALLLGIVGLLYFIQNPENSSHVSCLTLIQHLELATISANSNEFGKEVN